MTLPLYYNWRNLLRRRTSSVLTFVVVAVLVFILAVLLSFTAGIRASLAASGSSRNVIVLAQGATSESTSVVLPQEASRVVQAPGIARSPSGELLLSHELCVQTSIPRRGGDGGLANVAVRGVDDIAFEVHTEVQIVEGRRPRQGAMEVVVGDAARDRYANLELGNEVSLGRLENRAYQVVGVFDAQGGALESEIWAPRTLLTDSYNRPFVSSVVFRVEDGASVSQAIDYIRGPSVQLEAKTETAYYEELSSRSAELVWLVTILVSIMATGAAFAVANTMFAAVDGRRREIAMLRTVGFSRAAIMFSFVIESLLICTTACVVGLGLSLLVTGTRQDFLSDTTWTVLAYELTITPRIVAAAVTTTTLVGLAGALAPALRAARVQVIEALRKA